MIAQSGRSAPVGTALMTVGVLMVLVSLTDLISNVVPTDPGSMEWRYGAVGVASTFLVTPLLGLVLVLAGAELQDRPGLTKAIGWLCWVLTALLVLALLAFVLDGLQFRQMNQDERRTLVTGGVAIASGKLLGGVVAFALVARSAGRLGRSAKPKDADSNLVVGRK